MSLKVENIFHPRFIISYLLYFTLTLLIGLSMTVSGPGVSPDSVWYISAAENLLKGKGLAGSITASLDISELTPYSAWPPLYPLSIAFLSSLKLDSTSAARFCSILPFAFLMIPLFMMGVLISNSKVAHLSCITCMFLTPLVSVSTYAWPESLYIFLSSLAILSLLLFTQRTGVRSGFAFLLSGLFISLAILTRYIGITLLLMGIIAIFLKDRRINTRNIRRIIALGVISLLPVSIWFIRNIRVTGSLWGISRPTVTYGLLDNLALLSKTLIADLLPSPSPALQSSWDKITPHLTLIFIAILVIIFIISLIISPSPRSRLKLFLSNSLVLLLYGPIYLLSLLFLRSTMGFQNFETRLITSSYPFLVISSISLFYIVLRYMRGNRIKLYISSLSILLFLLFLSFQILHTLRYYNYAKDGQVYTNIVWREDEAIQWIKDNTDPQDHIYSNYADAVHFLTKRSVKYLPFRGAEESVRYFFAKERGTVRTYVIALKEVGWKGYVLTNDDIMENNKKYKTLFVIKDFPRAVIYKFKQ